MTLTRKLHPLNNQYSLYAKILDLVMTCKYLGLVISPNLKWNEHVSHIGEKLSHTSKLGYWRQN